ncbi:hypothetical protein [Microbacterium aurum]
MSLQHHLSVMLGDWFAVEGMDASGFVIRPTAGAPVRILATEASLSEYAARNAADGLMALGDVGDDSSGVLAALALLSVHIMETIEAQDGDAVTLLSVANGALSVRRTHSRVAE